MCSGVFYNIIIAKSLLPVLIWQPPRHRDPSARRETPSFWASTKTSFQSSLHGFASRHPFLQRLQQQLLFISKTEWLSRANGVSACTGCDNVWMRTTGASSSSIPPEYNLSFHWRQKLRRFGNERYVEFFGKEDNNNSGAHGAIIRFYNCINRVARSWIISRLLWRANKL